MVLVGSGCCGEGGMSLPQDQFPVNDLLIGPNY